eukprot:snap_masked-scaffold_14-processed-gene-8.21-mRNA-1 protein AED:0.43 eAED:0.43 QI:0/-1/0/1/-1/1/1/0/768
MSLKLKELIRKHRARKTAAEERALISKELAIIRTSFTTQDGPKHHKLRNMSKLIYIHLLNQNHSTSFGEMECLRLIAFNGMYLKRVGYLALTVLCDDNPELIQLSTNSISLDLQSNSDKSSNYVLYQALGLNCISNMRNKGLCVDLSSHISSFLQNYDKHTPYIKNKILLVLLTYVRVNLISADEFVDQLLSIAKLQYEGKNPNNLTLYTLFSSLLEELSCFESFGEEVDETEFIQIKERIVILLSEKVFPIVCKLIKGLLGASSISHNEVKKSFLQIKLFRFVGNLVRLNVNLQQDAANFLHEVLGGLNLELEKPLKNVSSSLVYEIGRTITKLNVDDRLNAKAVSMLASFLSTSESGVSTMNLRYVCLNLYSQMLQENYPGYFELVNKYSEKILACMEDNDPTIKSKASKLIFSLLSLSNYEYICEKILEFLERNAGACFSKSDAFVFEAICFRFVKAVQYIPNDDSRTLIWKIKALRRLIFFSTGISANNLTLKEIVPDYTKDILINLVTALKDSEVRKELLTDFWSFLTSMDTLRYLSNANMKCAPTVFVSLLSEEVLHQESINVLRGIGMTELQCASLFKDLLTQHSVSQEVRLAAIDSVVRMYGFASSSLQNVFKGLMSRASSFEDLETQVSVSEYEQVLRMDMKEIFRESKLEVEDLNCHVKDSFGSENITEYGFILNLTKGNSVLKQRNSRKVEASDEMLLFDNADGVKDVVDELLALPGEAEASKDNGLGLLDISENIGEKKVETPLATKSEDLFSFDF